MGRRVVRLGVLLAGVTGLLVTATPPAHATTRLTVLFTGTVTLGNGIAYQCFDSKTTPTINPAKCTPPTTTTKNDPKGVPTTNFTFSPPNSASFNFAAGFGITTVMGIPLGTCTAQGTTTDKPFKNAAEGGTCTMTGGGTVTGYCNLFTLTLAGGAGPGAPAPNNVQGYTYTLKGTGINGLVNLTGTVTKTASGETGNITATVQVVNVVGSCLTKEPKTLFVAGKAVVKIA